MVSTRCPAATTSPARASRYCTRPLLGETSTKIDKNRLEPLDIGLGGLDGGIGLITLGVGRNIGGFRRFEFVATLVRHLLRDMSLVRRGFLPRS